MQRVYRTVGRIGVGLLLMSSVAAGVSSVSAAPLAQGDIFAQPDPNPSPTPLGPDDFVQPDPDPSPTPLGPDDFVQPDPDPSPTPWGPDDFEQPDFDPSPTPWGPDDLEQPDSDPTQVPGDSSDDPSGGDSGSVDVKGLPSTGVGQVSDGGHSGQNQGLLVMVGGMFMLAGGMMVRTVRTNRRRQ